MQNCNGVGVIYRSPIQDNVEFEDFLSDSDELLRKTASPNSWFTIILGNFNATSSSWRKEDKTAAEGTHLEALTPLHNFDQLISEPKLTLFHYSSCTDLIFTNQPKLHHQITHCKLNHNIEYPPQYQRLVWNYKKANTESIKKSIESVNSKTLFNKKTVRKQVLSLMKLYLIFFSTLFSNNLLHLMIVTLLK